MRGCSWGENADFGWRLKKRAQTPGLRLGARRAHSPVTSIHKVELDGWKEVIVLILRRLFFTRRTTRGKQYLRMFYDGRRQGCARRPFGQWSCSNARLVTVDSRTANFSRYCQSRWRSDVSRNGKIASRAATEWRGYGFKYPTFRQGYTLEIERLEKAGEMDIKLEPL